MVNRPKSMSAPPVWRGVCTARTLGSHSTHKTSTSASGIEHRLFDLSECHKVRSIPFDQRRVSGLCPLRVEYRKLGEAYHWSTVLTPLIHHALRARLWPGAR